VELEAREKPLPDVKAFAERFNPVPVVKELPVKVTSVPVVIVPAPSTTCKRLIGVNPGELLIPKFWENELMENNANAMAK
jgi:hypothetical protein